ncbi:hypothetical protein [Streptomyces sp. NBC_00878]|uniref:hypothetical protein n=1 Tax=Streptomyces sp. NBC_00878 TaxID=2975854 RepID=UPI00225A4F7B|nr:hypothetical protein [Streptomyces sp. NBC_00878]MCX4903988.1 hypothetical protein [Streptomyces sp. NBC_00878]
MARAWPAAPLALAVPHAARRRRLRRLTTKPTTQGQTILSTGHTSTGLDLIIEVNDSKVRWTHDIEDIVFDN